jgi:hypothetical protein
MGWEREIAVLVGLLIGLAYVLVLLNVRRVLAGPVTDTPIAA